MSYRSSPDPNHSPIPQSPSVDGSGSGLNSPYYTEKDPLDNGRFGSNRYASNEYLSPNPINRNGASNGGIGGSHLKSKRYSEPIEWVPTNPKKRRWLFRGIPIALVIIAAIAIGVIVAIVHHNKTSTSTSGSSTKSSADSNGKSSGSTTSTSSGISAQASAIAADIAEFGASGTGLDGSIVTTDLGVNFTYTNSFGGSWAQNPENPYSVSIRRLFSLSTCLLRRIGHLSSGLMGCKRYLVERRVGVRVCLKNGFGDKTSFEGESPLPPSVVCLLTTNNGSVSTLEDGSLLNVRLRTRYLRIII